jgi:Flp pilus assembly protein TadG
MSRFAQHTLDNLRRDRSGVSAIEFAVIASIMVTLMVGAYDFGNAAMHQIQLQQAVRLGGVYAMNRPTDVSGIQTAVAAALPMGWTLSNPGGVAAIACSCLDPAGGGTTALAGCSAADFDTCTAPNTATMIGITATMPYTTLTPLFAGALPNNTATYVTRFR